MTVIEAVTAVSAATIYVSSDAQWAQITKKFYYENFIFESWKSPKILILSFEGNHFFKKCDLKVIKILFLQLGSHNFLFIFML